MIRVVSCVFVVEFSVFELGGGEAYGDHQEGVRGVLGTRQKPNRDPSGHGRGRETFESSF